MIKSIAAAVAGVMVLASSPALAQGLYAGGSVGLSSMEVDANGFDGSDVGFKIFGGYRFNDYIAVEAFYTDFGEPNDGPLGIDAYALGIAGVGILPLAERFELFGKVGVAAWDADFTGPGGFSDDGTDLVLGAGVTYKFSPQFSGRVELEYYDIEADAGPFDVDTYLLSAGLQFNF